MSRFHATLLLIGLAAALGAAGCGPALTAAGIAGLAAIQKSRSALVDSPPAVTVETPAGALNDIVPVEYRLTDFDTGDRADVVVSYSRDGGASFRPTTGAFVEGAEGTTNLSTSATGETHTYFWNTAKDLGPTNQTGILIRIAVTPAGEPSGAGSSAQTSAFAVLNRFMTTLAAQAAALELQPTALTLDGGGDVFLADGAGHRVLRLGRTSGTTTLLAGTGTAGFAEGNLPALSAQLNLPLGLGVDPQGDVLVADFLNLALRRVQLGNGFITVAAGQGDSLQDGELASQAFLFLPRDLALDAQGNAYVLTENGQVRVINLQGTTTLTFSYGTTTCTSLSGSQISVGPGRISTLIGGNPKCGLGPSAYTRRINQGRALVLEESGSERVAYVLDVGGAGSTGGSSAQLFAANLGTTAVTRFSLVTQSSVSILPGDTATLAQGSVFNQLGNSPDLALGAGGALLVSSPDANRVTALNVTLGSVQIGGVSVASGSSAPVLGSGQAGFEGDGLAGTSAQLFFPTSVAGDAAGNVYVGEANGRLRVAAGGSGLSFAGQSIAAGRVATLPAALPNVAPAIVSPTLIAQDPSGDLIFTDSALSDPRSNRVFRLDRNTGALTPLLGSGILGDTGDGGPATQARVGQLGSPALSPDGRVLCVPDVTHHRVRAVNLSGATLDFLGVQIAAGAVQTVVGVGQVTSGSLVPLGDGGPASSASLFRPVTVDFDGAGLLWIGDNGNHRIRVCNPTGKSQTLLGVTLAADTIQTVVGTGQPGGSGADGEGGPAGQAKLGRPGALLGPDGNLYLVDETSAQIPRVRVVNLGSQAIVRGTVSVPTGAIATLAGSGQARLEDDSNLGDGGAALSATFRSISGLTLTPGGLLFLSDEEDHRVRVVNLAETPQTLRGVSLASGAIQTALGSGIPAFQGDPGAVGATFSGGLSPSPLDGPSGLLAFSDGRLIVLDTNNGALRLANFADGPRGFAGANANSGQVVIVAGQRAGKVRIRSPLSVRVAADESVIFSDQGQLQSEPAVLRLDPQTRLVTRLAGTGERTSFDGSDLGDGGQALLATFGEVRGIDLDPQGSLYVADATNRRLRFVNRTSTDQTPLAGVTVGAGAIQSLLDGNQGDGNADNDEGRAVTGGGVDLFLPNSVSFSSGALWVTDEGSDRLLRIDTAAGTVAGVFSRSLLAAGTGTLGAGSTGATVLQDLGANFTGAGVAAGDLVTLNGSSGARVQAVLSATQVTVNAPVSGGAIAYRIERDDSPVAVVAISSTQAYLAVQSQARGGSRILELTYTGSGFSSKAIAGNGIPGWNGDLLSASDLQLGEVRGMYLSGSLLYLTDTGNHRVVAINTSSASLSVADLVIGPGEARTVAGGGQGTPGFNGDAIPPHLALLNRPTGVAVGPRDEVVVVDGGNGRLRRFER